MRKQRRRSASRISAFVFATQIVQSLYFLKLKFQASSHLLYLYSLVCVGPGRKPECWFSHDAAQIADFSAIDYSLVCFFCSMGSSSSWCMGKAASFEPRCEETGLPGF